MISRNTTILKSNLNNDPKKVEVKADGVIRDPLSKPLRNQRMKLNNLAKTTRKINDGKI